MACCALVAFIVAQWILVWRAFRSRLAALRVPRLLMYVAVAGIALQAAWLARDVIIPDAQAAEMAAAKQAGAWCGDD